MRPWQRHASGYYLGFLPILERAIGRSEGLYNYSEVRTERY